LFEANAAAIQERANLETALPPARPEPIPVYAEMGSINPVFLLPGARQQNAEAIASGLQASVTLGVGQFCTNPGLVFIVKGPAAQAFLQELERAMAATPPGTMLIADLRAAYRSGAEKFAKTPGVRRAVSVNAAADAGNAKVGAALFVTDAATFLKNHSLMDEVFGPSTLIVECASRDQMFAAARQLEGQLTATIHALPNELVASRELVELLAVKAGRLFFNGFPTGVEVCHAMTHGGPYPATADGRSTSVGTRAIARFARPVCYQNFPDAALPEELKESNPLGLWRLVDGNWERK
jgi:alpha-ketoglutaric semialdehyde dehydrogenase